MNLSTPTEVFLTPGGLVKLAVKCRCKRTSCCQPSTASKFRITGSVSDAASAVMLYCQQTSQSVQINYETHPYQNEDELL